MGEQLDPHSSDAENNVGSATYSIIVDAEIAAHFSGKPTGVSHVFLALLAKDTFTRDVFSARSQKDLEEVIASLKACIDTPSPIPVNASHGRTDALRSMLAHAEEFAKKEQKKTEPRHLLKAIITQKPVDYYVHLAVSRNMDMTRLPKDFAIRERRDRK